MSYVLSAPMLSNYTFGTPRVRGQRAFPPCRTCKRGRGHIVPLPLKWRLCGKAAISRAGLNAGSCGNLDSGDNGRRTLGGGDHRASATTRDTPAVSDGQRGSCCSNTVAQKCGHDHHCDGSPVSSTRTEEHAIHPLDGHFHRIYGWNDHRRHLDCCGLPRLITTTSRSRRLHPLETTLQPQLSARCW